MFTLSAIGSITSTMSITTPGRDQTGPNFIKLFTGKQSFVLTEAEKHAKAIRKSISHHDFSSKQPNSRRACRFTMEVHCYVTRLLTGDM